MRALLVGQEADVPTLSFAIRLDRGSNDSAVSAALDIPKREREER